MPGLGVGCMNIMFPRKLYIAESGYYQVIFISEEILGTPFLKQSLFSSQFTPRISLARS